MIPRLDAALIAQDDPETLDALRVAATQVGFATVYNTGISAQRVQDVIDAYAAFFGQPCDVKRSVDMAVTGANRGWGAAHSEKVDEKANADYKQVFDCGFSLPAGDARAALPVYAPNQWPSAPEGFQAQIEAYFSEACTVAAGILDGIAKAIDMPADYFEGAFDTPMALLRGNYYPARPAWATSRDFGIAEHTDYGCLTLLATDGSPGLEVRMPDGEWHAVQAPVGEFIINFGEMLESWTAGKIRATAHRVIGTNAERISVPLFFNPVYETNIAPLGSGEKVLAGDHLMKRFQETYVHLK